jgi:HprK-related kinase A
MAMRLGELALQEVRHRLRTGLALATGPFVFRIESRLPAVAANLHRLYADFPLSEGPFADFHVRVDRVAGPRRWIRPQAQFWLDATQPFKPLPADQAYAMLEWGMNWCISSHAHHYLMLHAAVLERGGRALILPGDPGAGKSTLTAALMLDGWRLLSDELTLMDRDDGLLYGLARPVSLKNASIEVIRAHAPAAVFGDVARDTHKGTVSHLKPSAESVDRLNEPARPAWIVFPRWQAQAPARLTPHPKAAAFLHLASHAFNYSLLGALGFKLTADLMDACQCWDFEYGHLPEALQRFRALAAT